MSNLDSDSFIDEIISSAIGSDNKILICGINFLGLTLNLKLSKYGLSENVIGFYDPINQTSKKIFAGKSRFGLEELNTIPFDEIVITYDKEKEIILENLHRIKLDRKLIRIFGNDNYAFDDKIFSKINSSLHIKSIAAGYPEMLIHIYQSLACIEKTMIEGDIVEFGTFKGGTTVFMAKVLKEFGSTRKIYSFDTFKGFPGKRGLLDIFDEEKYGNVDFKTVKEYCSDYNIELISGDIVNTINEVKFDKIAFSFYDTDNYSATKMALEKIYPKTTKGGIFAFDHYHSEQWVKTIGERMAAKEFFLNKNVFNLYKTGIFIKLEE